MNEPSKKADSNSAVFCRTRTVRTMAILLNRKGDFALGAIPLLPRMSFAGKPLSKMALSSSNDRSAKNPEFPYAENYAAWVEIRNNYRRIDRQTIYFILKEIGLLLINCRGMSFKRRCF